MNDFDLTPGSMWYFNFIFEMIILGLIFLAESLLINGCFGYHIVQDPKVCVVGMPIIVKSDAGTKE